jgi:GNAT superfamily N-acetyltransferase
MATNGFTKEGAARIEVRIASETDAMMLAGLRYELRSSLHEVVENEAAFVERCATWMEQRLRKESHWKCWIAETNQIPVGSVWAQLIEKIPNPIAEPECYVYLTNFYVREEYRGKSIGAKLLSAVLAWSKSNDAYTVILWPTERSRPFYLRHGFSKADNLMELAIKSKT